MKELFIELKFYYDCDDGVDAESMIKDEIFETMPSVIGDGEVIIESIETL